mgnify:CR=1 FL=1
MCAFVVSLAYTLSLPSPISPIPTQLLRKWLSLEVPPSLSTTFLLLFFGLSLSLSLSLVWRTVSCLISP